MWVGLIATVVTLCVTGSILGSGVQTSAVIDVPVTRALTPDLAVLSPMPPIAVRDPMTPPVSHLIRQPVRLTDRSGRPHDLPAHIRDVLADFDYRGATDDALHRMLARALAQGQSDAYIDAVLNGAAARNLFVVPEQLQTPDGGVDTPRLLDAVLTSVRG